MMFSRLNLILFICGLYTMHIEAWNSNKIAAKKIRNNILRKIPSIFTAAIISTSLLNPSVSVAGYLSEVNAKGPLKLETISDIPKPKKSSRPHVYGIEFTDPPSLVPRTTAAEKSTIQKLASADAIIIGQHRQDVQDFELEKKILGQLQSEVKSKQRSVVLGLADISRSEATAKVIDNYLSYADSDEADKLLKDELSQIIGTQPTIDSASLLKYAKQNGIRVIPLGLPEQSDSVVIDPEGFVASTKGDGFIRYVSMSLRDDYDERSLADASKQENDMSGKKEEVKNEFQDYVGYRLLSDEAVAAASAQFIQNNPDSELVVVADKTRVKFGYGIQERLTRNLGKLKSNVEDIPSPIEVTESSTSTSTGTKSSPSDSVDKVATAAAPAASAVVVYSPTVYSVMLNPTPKDTGGNTAQLRYTLGYGKFLKDQRPLSNYIWYSNDPPVKFLARLKNAIDKEGEKPPGESSVLGVF